MTRRVAAALIAFVVVAVGGAMVGAQPAHAVKANPCSGTVPKHNPPFAACDVTAPSVLAGDGPVNIAIKYSYPGASTDHITISGNSRTDAGGVVPINPPLAPGATTYAPPYFEYTPPAPRFPPTSYATSFTYQLTNNLKKPSYSTTGTVTIPISQPPLGRTAVAGVQLSAPLGGNPTGVEFGVRNGADPYARTASYRLVISGAGRSFTYLPSIVDGGVFSTTVQLVPCTYTATVVDLTDGSYVAPVSTTVNVVGGDKSPRCRATAAASQVTGSSAGTSATPAAGSPAAAALARALGTSGPGSAGAATSGPARAGGSSPSSTSASPGTASPGSAAFSDAANQSSRTPGTSITEPLLFGAVGLAGLVGLSALAASVLERRRIGR